ncbi:MAG: GtrA family protein [Ruminococcaceae bacterium]|nr:GtrA family protein [Oscillospiraceae bacterium]
MKLKNLIHEIREKGLEPFKYLISSGVAFLINWFLFMILDKLIGGRLSWEFATIPAWLISSLTNFTMNRVWVFRSNSSLWKALTEYYSLAVVVYLIKTFVIMEFCSRVLRIDPSLSMPIAEVVLFVCNYFIQKKWIFRKKKNESDKT